MVQILKEATADYDYFVGQLKSGVTRRMGSEYTARTYKVMKNNSLELDSLVLMRRGKNFSPNIYLQPYYEAYQQGVKVSELVHRLCNLYEQASVPMVEDTFTFGYEQMKPFIIYRLVNYERNRRLLERIPHLRYLDLAVTYHCLIQEDKEGIGTIRITNEHRKQWSAPLKELHELAAENTRRLFPETLRSMEEVMRSMVWEKPSDDEERIQSEIDLEMDFTGQESRMYILSNQKGINGASCLLYPRVIQKLSESFQSDFYIFPSSIHELILVPTQNDRNYIEYSAMVREINATQVAREEVLSDNVYYYSRERGLTVLEAR